MRDDYALIHLDGTSSFEPVELMTFNPPFGTVGTAVGWGQTESGYGSFECRETDLTIIDPFEWLNPDDTAWFYPNNIITHDNDSSACYGDSGGPLLVDNKLVGVTSFGDSSSGCTGFNGFAGIPYVISWIASIMGDDFVLTSDDCPTIMGDMNGDGGLNVMDVVALANCVLASDCEYIENGVCGDLNLDGGWNVLDVIGLVNQVLVGNTGDMSGFNLASGVLLDRYAPPAGITKSEQDKILREILNAGEDINKIKSILDDKIIPKLKPAGRMQRSRRTTPKPLTKYKLEPEVRSGETPTPGRRRRVEPYCNNGVMLWGNCYDINTTTEVDLSGLTGTIPDTICELTNMWKLRLVDGELSGEVPECIWYMPNLTYINLSWNNLTGSFYNIQWQNSSIEKLLLQNNLFGGSFSETFCSSSITIHPSYLRVGYNHLCQEPLSCFPDYCFNDDGSFINEGCRPTHDNLSGECHMYGSPYEYCGDATSPSECMSCGGLEGLTQVSCYYEQNYCVGYQQCD